MDVVKIDNGLVPRSIRLYHGSAMTFVVERTPQRVYECFRELVGRFKIPSPVLAYGEPSFEDMIERELPPRSDVIKTTTLSQNSGYDDEMCLINALRNEHDHIFVQDLKRFEFSVFDSRSRESWPAIQYLLEIAHNVYGGMLGRSLSGTFAEIAERFPYLVSKSQEKYHRFHDGSLKIRVAYEGLDMSEDFREWAIKNHPVPASE